MPHRITWLAGSMAAAMALAGCGAKPAHVTSPAPSTSAPASPSVSAAPTRAPGNLALAGQSVNVPANWSHPAPHRSSLGNRTVKATGSQGAYVTLRESPLQKSNQPWIWDPAMQSAQSGGQPYLSESHFRVTHQDVAMASVVLNNGTMLSLTIATPTTAQTQHILATWQHPAPVTVTQAAKHLLALNHHAPEVSVSWPNSHDGWILTTGQPATAQQPYFLFQTRNGGQTWTIERQTNFQNCPPTQSQCVFPSSAGLARLDFVTPKQGVIALPSFAGNQVLLYQSQDGGKRWTLQPLRVPKGYLPNVGNPVRIHFSSAQQGTVTVSLITASGKPAPQNAVFTTSDGGLRWSLQ